MAKPTRPRRSPSISGSGSSSRSRSHSRSYSKSSSRSRSVSRSPSSSRSSSSASRSGSSRSRSSPKRRSPVDASKRGRSPLPQSKKASPAPRKASSIRESLVLYVDSLSRNVNEGHIKEIFGNFGEVVKVDLAMDRALNLPRGYGYVEFKTRADAEKALLYMDGAQIDGNVVSAKFTLPPRPKFSPPPEPISYALKRDLPKSDNATADIEKDGQKRLSSPQRKPLSPPRRRSPVGRRGGSPRRPADSPHKRVNSPVRRRGETPPRRRPASPPRGRSPVSPPRRFRSPPRNPPRRMRASPIRRRSPPLGCRSPPRRVRSPPRRSPVGHRRSRSPIHRYVRSRSRSISPRRGRGPTARRRRSSSTSRSPSPRKNEYTEMYASSHDPNKDPLEEDLDIHMWRTTSDVSRRSRHDRVMGMESTASTHSWKSPETSSNSVINYEVLSRIEELMKKHEEELQRRDEEWAEDIQRIESQLAHVLEAMSKLVSNFSIPMFVPPFVGASSAASHGSCAMCPEVVPQTQRVPRTQPDRDEEKDGSDEE